VNAFDLPRMIRKTYVHCVLTRAFPYLNSDKADSPGNFISPVVRPPLQDFRVIGGDDAIGSTNHQWGLRTSTDGIFTLMR